MDQAAFASEMFGDLPFFNPLMFVNLSSLCATTKLLQCKSMGIPTCDVTRKFYKDPSDAPDLDELDFMARKRVIEQVQKWCHEAGAKKKPELIDGNEWTPILYAWEVVRSTGRKTRDWGHLVFTDMTLTRFLLVMNFGEPTCGCGNPYHHDYDALTKYHANRFMSLLKYLHHDESKPVFVRATYTLLSKPTVHPDFLNVLSPPTKQYSPPIFHVTAKNYVPSLLESELEKINNLLVQSHEEVPPASVREEVLGKKQDKPVMETWLAGNARNARQCAYCEKVGQLNMPTCSNCKLVRYCGRECQRKAWPQHKRVCKKADAVSK